MKNQDQLPTYFSIELGRSSFMKTDMGMEEKTQVWAPWG